MGVSKNRGKTPQIIHFNRVSIINHPFWGTIIFGNIHIPKKENLLIPKAGAVGYAAKGVAGAVTLDQSQFSRIRGRFGGEVYPEL